jgi:hypothetical protein
MSGSGSQATHPPLSSHGRDATARTTANSVSDSGGGVGTPMQSNNTAGTDPSSSVGGVPTPTTSSGTVGTRHHRVLMLRLHHHHHKV